jgi:hypothetical protein
MSSNALISIDAMVCDNIAQVVKQHTLNAIRELSEVYGFGFDEAVSHLKIDEFKVKKAEKAEKAEKPENPEKPKKPEKAKKAKALKKPEIELPFCGIKMEGFCCAIKKSQMLFNQCSKLTKNTYCTVCQKQADKNSTNKPNIGDIRDRIEQGNDWSDPTGKKPVKYIKIMEKQNISKEQAIAVAEKFGLTIPETEFVFEKSSKGRPKKSVSADDTDDEKEKKKRGRPEKKKENENKTPGDDLIAHLIEEAKNEEDQEKPKKKASTKKPKKKDVDHEIVVVAEPDPEVEKQDDSELEEEEIEDVVEVVKKTINGKNYLLDNNNVVYDEEQNEIGTYDEENVKIVYFDDAEEV